MSSDEPPSLILNRFDEENSVIIQSYDESMIKILKHHHNQNAYAFSTLEFENRSWLKSVVDSSHLITFCISITVIIYASFKSLNIDSGECANRASEIRKNDEDDSDKDDENEYSFFINDQVDSDSGSNHTKIQNIDAIQAMFIPVIASISLLIMFFFFDSIQTAFVICTSVLAIIAFSYLLSPICKILLGLFTKNHEIINKKRSCFLLGRYRLPDFCAFLISLVLITLWILTGHWILMDMIGIGFCITFITIIRLPSLKVSILLLLGLVIYDVIWVYFSHFIFSSNVMVKVATKEADNPFDILAKRFNFDFQNAPKLSLPGKLVIPSYQNTGNFSILGLGDIVIPGLLLCFVLRFDAFKRSQVSQNLLPEEELNDLNKTQPSRCKTSKPKLRRYFSYPSNLRGFIAKSKTNHVKFSIRNLIRFRSMSYFHCSLIGYFFGLFTATMSSEIFREAQPALLFLVPFTLLPLIIMAYVKGDLYLMWNEPFNYKPTKYFFV
ncbi:unnamed protein product [Brachionus calyciflorus]|uniref:Signal peptide peptidase-like 3 n=1 Tax=Brachionus calyciflorus TaxID=104777 RepID=A0A814FX09_9BILA|nr:unnamed protein product [Brachionus calyciflorus]